MLTIRSLTGGEKEGGGVFDELMRTVKSHVQEELTSGRITERAYSEVYLNALQYALTTSAQYTLQYEKVNKELEVMDENILQAQKQNELLELQKEQLQIANDTARYNLQYILPEQLIKMKKETELAQTQIDLAKAQLALTGKQEDLLDEQIRAAKDTYTNPTGGTNKAEYDKVMAEVSILVEKLRTEKANTRGTIDGAPVEGLVGKEILLKANQAASFERNAEIQAAKLYSDIFSIMYSTDPEGMDNQAFGFGSDESFEVLKMVSKGIKVPNVDSGFDHDHPSSDLPPTGGN